MNSHSNPQRRQLLSPKEISTVKAKVEAWLVEQNETGDFESSWASVGSIVGGGFIGIDSPEELANAVSG